LGISLVSFIEVVWLAIKLCLNLLNANWYLLAFKYILPKSQKHEIKKHTFFF
jgi:hypothetical protein